MKNKNYLIIGVIVILLIIGSIFGIYFYKNSKKLTINEKNWLDEVQKSNLVLNINVINNANVFGDNGTGVFYEFLDDFSEEYNLNINKIAFNYGAAVSGVSLNAKLSTDKNDIVFYKDHYVLLSKKSEIINDFIDLNGKTIGILAKDMSYVTGYISNGNITYNSYETDEELFASLDTDGYVIVPLHLYLQEIVKNDYKIVYHLSDVNMYYTLSTVDDNLSSVIRKYYAKWEKDYDDYYNETLFDLVASDLNISETEIDAMRSITYDYGYVNNSPYEVIKNGNYGGIAAVYLRGFQKFADIDFNFTKYRNYSRFNKAVAKDEVNVYFGYNNLVSDFKKTETGINVEYVIAANEKNDIVFNSINSLEGKTVFVDRNSVLNTYLNGKKNIKVKTYSKPKDLLKFNRKDVILFVDKNIFDYYKNHGLNKYTSRYEGSLNYVYGFNVKSNETLYKLLNEYMAITDSKTVLNQGILNHEKTVKSGMIFSLIARYFIYLALFLALLALLLVRKTKKITIAKRIKKDDKLRFIDQLTLLKNRNFLSENIENWNNNNVYPQAILIVDLNKVQNINDTKGYEEGDKQIKAAANILIKTQLDNSEIIRTNGNEFVVYMVGYSQKQITNYIHKLNKQFKKLPYDYGAEFGYSMIIDDIKTIEDALNEATKTLKEQKGLNEKKD